MQVNMYNLDMSSREAIYQTAEQVKAEVGDVDILINNAGITYIGTLDELNDDGIARTQAVNCTAHFWVK